MLGPPLFTKHRNRRSKIWNFGRSPWLLSMISIAFCIVFLRDCWTRFPMISWPIAYRLHVWTVTSVTNTCIGITYLHYILFGCDPFRIICKCEILHTLNCAKKRNCAIYLNCWDMDDLNCWNTLFSYSFLYGVTDWSNCLPPT